MRGATGEEGRCCALPCPLLSELCWVLASQALGPQRNSGEGKRVAEMSQVGALSGNKTNQL